jgi:formimidoylglutamase
VGAASGPLAFRKAYARLKGRDPVRENLAIDRDALPMGRDIPENHRQAADLIRSAHLHHPLSVVVGGGNDHSFSQIVGLSEAARGSVGVINIDAHFDVRKPAPQITSGSPFYLALESGLLKPAHFIEFGIQRHCNGPELWKYIEAKKVKIVPFEKLREGRAVKEFAQALKSLASRCDSIIVSLDLDAIAEAFAPGVSAPQAEGFTPSEILEMLRLSGEHAKVASLGIFELNPEHDRDHQTARLAAVSAWHFIAHAYASRKALSAPRPALRRPAR